MCTVFFCHLLLLKFRPYSGEYLRLNDHGIYCCIVCGEEIFSSETKYDSGCGWPAFYNTIDADKLITQTDLSHGKNLSSSFCCCCLFYFHTLFMNFQSINHSIDKSINHYLQFVVISMFKLFFFRFLSI